jgi:peptidoglycan/LPS O-acetylase OafA/YrhL
VTRPAPRRPSRPTPPPAPPRISPLPFAGMVGLACVLFLDLASGLVVAWPVVVVLVVAWVVLFVMACAWWTPHPERLPWLGAVAFGIWLVVVIGGSALAG